LIENTVRYRTALAAAAAGAVMLAIALTAAPPVMKVVAGAGAAGFADGVGAEARFNKPIRLAPFGPDAILVSDIFNHAIRSVSKDGRVKTIAGAPDRKGHQDGPAATARFASPHGVGTSADGRIAVAEAEGHTLRLLTPDAAAAGGYVVSTLAGTPGKSGSTDGPAREAQFNSPHAALWGADGALYAPDIGNATIRRLKDGRVDTVAGSGGDKMVYPMDIAWTRDGRMIIADAGANQLRTWRHGEALGTVAVQGALATPHGVTAGADGTIYVADMKSHRVLAIDQTGRITTLAGVEGQAGGDAVHLNRPAAVLVHAGWLWIADLDNHRICAVPLERQTRDSGKKPGARRAH
jgi:DNA-binding beta-propeller fold protein YncE